MPELPLAPRPLTLPLLYLVPTPIGNLKDITLRAIEVLKSADAIACEDTRRTGELLKHLGIGRGGPGARLFDENVQIGHPQGVSLRSFHDHSGPGRLRELTALLKEGKTVALVTDGGTPLISDPGFTLVREAIREGIKVEALPGATAVIPALAVSGLPAERFTFWGFLPQKSGKRKKELEEASLLEHTVLFYESPHRVLAALEEMVEIFGDREAAACRELTKKFEEVVRGNLSALVQHFQINEPRGEFVLVVAGKDRKKIFT